LVQGRVFSQAGLDSLENGRMKGKKFSPAQRAAYTTIGLISSQCGQPSSSNPFSS